MHLTLHLTERCNLRCRYCYAAPHGERDMSFDTARAAIEIALADRSPTTRDRSLGVIFFGGEPLLKRDLILGIVRHCREIEERTGCRFHFKITTNGIMLDDEFLTAPYTRDVFVALSCDGVREAHDAHRVDAAGRGTWHAVDAAAEMLLRRRPYAPAMMVVNPDTVQFYAASVEHLYARGFHYIVASLNYGAEWSDGHVRELSRQYRRIAEWYYERSVAEDKFYFSPFEAKIASCVDPGGAAKDRCELGRTQISVAPDGGLYPCVQFVGDPAFRIGHATTGLDEAAREGLYTLSAEEKAECGGCALSERCNHHCGCLNRQATGRVDRVAPLLCAHERAIMPIVDRVAARLYRRRAPMFIQKHYNELFPLVSLVEDASVPDAASCLPTELLTDSPPSIR